TATHTNAHTLASAIKARREELGLSLHRVAVMGGPTKPTQIRYESGDIPAGTQSGTLAKYDTALRWAIGTAEAILYGSAPAPQQPAEVIELPVTHEVSPDTWEVDSGKLRGLLGAVRKLSAELVDKIPEIPQEVLATV